MGKILSNEFKLEAKLLDKKLGKVFKRVLHSGWYILGKEVESFEKEFAEFLNAKFCIGTGNGLEALQISLMAAGVGKGDEVITTPISAVATTLAILATGAAPVFVDTDELGLMDVNLIEKAITKKTKAILPVHLYGNPVKLDQFLAICKKHNLILIEDACQAHGSTNMGKKLGTFGLFGCFSFYPTKNLGALGDGGAIVTNDAKLGEVCREIRDYGQSGKYVHSRYGLNSRLDELQAAILREKLRHLNKFNQKRRMVAKWYMSGLKNLNQVKLVISDNPDDSCFHQFVIRVKKRDKLQKHLASKGIQTLIHYPITIPDQPFLKGKIKANIPKARLFSEEVLSLPCHPFITKKEVDYITSGIKSFFKNYS